MKTITTAAMYTKATPEAIFDLWSDVTNWPSWDRELEWVKPDGEFKAGTKGALKPKNGPKTKYTTIEVTQNKSFEDVSHLPGAKLYFFHKIETVNNDTKVTHIVSINGPLAWLWTRILGKNLEKGLQPALVRLVKLAEQK